MSLSDAFHDHPELRDAATAFQNYLNNSGVSADIDILPREHAYPLLQIRPKESSLQAIQESLEEKGIAQ